MSRSRFNYLVITTCQKARGRNPKKKNRIQGHRKRKHAAYLKGAHCHNNEVALAYSNHIIYQKMAKKFILMMQEMMAYI